MIDVLFRADSSSRLGMGHVMRCLTLADSLRRRGLTSGFAHRLLPGNMALEIQERGHRLLVLAAPSGATGDDRALGLPQTEDARQTAALLSGTRVKWVVADHYALDTEWEAAMRPHCQRLAVIDDLADRRHDCDIVLDQTLGRAETDYQPLVPRHCRLLLGPGNALLRKEFAAFRDQSLARRRAGAKLEQIQISIGGMDADGITDLALQAVRQAAPRIGIDVVLSARSPAFAAVSRRCASLGVRLHTDQSGAEMAQMMAASDLAIGAGGTTSWERCCLGLPTLAILTATNQRTIVNSLARAGAVRNCGSWERPEEINVAQTVRDYAARPDRLAEMSEAAAAICDGLGAERVAEEMN